MSALVDIEAERIRQLDHGFDSAHDAAHTDGSLVVAAAALLGTLRIFDREEWVARWARHMYDVHSHRELLVIAASMIVAEIDRLDTSTGDQNEISD